MVVRKKKKSSERSVKQILVNKRKDIKNKLNILKHEQVAHETLFQPITKHLQNIESKLDPNIKQSTTTNEKTLKPPSPRVKYIKSEDSDYDDDESEDIETDKDSVASEPIFPSTSTYQNTPHGMKLPMSAPRMKRKLHFSTGPPPPNPDTLRTLLVTKAERELLEEEAKKQREYEDQLNKTLEEKTLTDYYEQYHSLPAKYIKKYLRDPKSETSEGKFRVKFDKDIERFSIGNKTINFDGPDLLIGTKRFTGTSGLYGLLFNRNPPTSYTKNDAKHYTQILSMSDAIKYVQASRNTKFKKIIKPIIQKPHIQLDSDENDEDSDSREGTKQGRGMFMKVTNNPIDYVYWDDPNELVERLQLLVASATAGNTSHTNEINSIVEELREANIIE